MGSHKKKLPTEDVTILLWGVPTWGDRQQTNIHPFISTEIAFSRFNPFINIRDPKTPLTANTDSRDVLSRADPETYGHSADAKIFRKFLNGDPLFLNLWHRASSFPWFDGPCLRKVSRNHYSRFIFPFQLILIYYLIFIFILLLNQLYIFFFILKLFILIPSFTMILLFYL